MCNTCKTCLNFDKKELHEDGFIIGYCSLEPFDRRDMTINSIAVQCGHDGGISVGESFGCINFQKSIGG